MSNLISPFNEIPQLAKELVGLAPKKGRYTKYRSFQVPNLLEIHPQYEGNLWVPKSDNIIEIPGIQFHDVEVFRGVSPIGDNLWPYMVNVFSILSDDSVYSDFPGKRKLSWESFMWEGNASGFAILDQELLPYVSMVLVSSVEAGGTPMIITSSPIMDRLRLPNEVLKDAIAAFNRS